MKMWWMIESAREWGKVSDSFINTKKSLFDSLESREYRNYMICANLGVPGFTTD